MIALGRHWEFIAAGYLGVGLVLALLVAWTAIDSRRQKARLEALAEAGDRRDAR